MNRRSFATLLPALPAGAAAAVQSLAQRTQHTVMRNNRFVVAADPVPLTREFLRRHLRRYTDPTPDWMEVGWRPEWLIRLPVGHYRLEQPLTSLGVPAATLVIGSRVTMAADVDFARFEAGDDIRLALQDFTVDWESPAAWECDPLYLQHLSWTTA